jgi:hypothetical protein
VVSVPGAEDEGHGRSTGLLGEGLEPLRVPGELGTVSSPELGIARREMAEPPTELVARRELLEPSGQFERGRRTPSWPEPVDEVASAVALGNGVVGPFRPHRHGWSDLHLGGRPSR